MKRVLGLLVLGSMLVGCSGARPVPPPSVVPQPAPPASPEPANVSSVKPVSPPTTDTPPVEKVGNVIRVLGLDSYMGDWVWSPDGSQIGFQAKGAIWSIRPDGSRLEAMVRSSSQLDLLGWVDEGLVCTERSAEGLVVRVQATPELGREYRTPDEWTEQGAVQYRLFGSHLLVMVSDKPAGVLDLRTGKIKEIDKWDEVEEIDGLVPTDDEQYVLYWQRTRTGDEALHVIDLKTAKSTVIAGAIYFPLVDWAADHRWAATVGLPSSTVGDSQMNLSLSLHVGSTEGQVKALPPPQPLRFTMPRPYWSPDGTQVAVEANENGASADPHAKGIWVVDVGSGRWKKVGVVSTDTLIGWVDNKRLLLWGGSEHVWLSVLDGVLERRPITTRQFDLPDGSRVYAEFQPSRTWDLYREPLGGSRASLLEGFGPPTRLEVRGSYAAMDPTEPGAPVLVIVPVD